MDLQKIYTDSDFQNAAVPEGQILLFNGTENGKPVTRYKDSSGNFGTLSGGGGGGGGGGADVTLGQIDADGNFQPLAFDGQTASNDGEPETVESYYGWNGTLKVPDKGFRVIQGGDAVYYKCASVDTTSKTWTGYLAVLGDDGTYSFEETATAGLTYGTAFVPTQGKIYNTDATVAVSGLYEGRDPNLVFYAPLTDRSAAAETGQAMTETGTVQYTTFGGRECAYFDDSSYLEITEYNLPIGGVPFTLFARIAFTGTVEGANHLLKFGEFIGFRSWGSKLIPYANTGDTIWKENITTDVFYATAATYDGSIFTLFVDGEKISKSETALNPASGNIRIGTGHDGGSGSGYVSDVRIYNRCLTAEEIAELTNN